ncbi:hypothetical protein Q5692_22580 [Microcoleus sp. C2C3]|uniref:hypothetical protein n=1 Tax=unclassified Microcoleus TaxID=2642155 RepID=UPI002FCFECBE
MQTLGFKTALSARLVYKCTTKVVARGVILDNASDSPDGMIYGNHSIVSDRSAVDRNKLKTKGKKMQKTEFFWNSAF